MFEGTATSADGTAIAYTAWGEGEPIIIIDGATAYRATTPENAQAAELLADEFQVVNYDRRGRGQSGDTAPYAVEREIEDLAAIIEQACGGRPATVFGWSSGGHLALNAADGGVRMERVAVFEPPVVVDRSRAPFPDDYVERLEAALAAGRPGDAVELFMTAAVGLPPETVAGMRESDMWPGLEAIAHTISYDGRNLKDTVFGKPLRADLWNRIEIPVLVMHGIDTWPFLATGAEAVAELLPTAALKPVPGENHSTTPEVLAAALREFIKEGA
ncbi:alpha/beta hydrolase [Glycomyces sp. TRM65418]|uniref:alpha/beta fold hydrolase n=1 Tax=Glycomyces sp. TRM65418 TaxID=2867006 RepID=UPI001CE6A3E6|nr:alpha/beta hydrolase [Glycomyces sp. TRM65418]MCC3762547.1 alpha/beta hydrolase [Glycomyces sp. TRM65418]QZD56586.1 alpha/beta hydrolase [Glycomyces sp. TRM65418]